jgi:hypothetical protein
MVYIVTGEDQNGCQNSTTYVQIVNLCAGLNELKENTNFSIYPNPTRENLFVEYDVTSTHSGKIIIEDIQGKQVRTHVMEHIEKVVEIKNLGLEPGIYFCRFFIGDKVSALKKLVITN